MLICLCLYLVFTFLSSSYCLQIHQKHRNNAITQPLLKKKLCMHMSSERVVVFGASGGVGQLICKSLHSDGYLITAITRDSKKLKDIPNVAMCDVIEADALKPETILDPVHNSDIIIISVGTTAFPTSKWGNGNTPQKACLETVSNILSIIETRASLPRKVILLSSIGVERRDQMPFKLLNSFGVLDAKLMSEKLLLEQSHRLGYDAVIIRPGRLVGAPFTNFDLAKLLGLNQGVNKGITVSKADILNGDVERSDIATIIKRMLSMRELSSQQLIFSVVNCVGTEMDWESIEKNFIET